MGYTHHWEFDGEAEFNDQEWATLVRFIRELAAARNMQGRHGVGSVQRIYGAVLQWSDPGLPGSTEVVWIDGGCELFFLPRKPALALPPGLTEEWVSTGSTLMHEDTSVRVGFCKTNGLPYDTLVTATLCAVWHLFRRMLLRVSSDGDRTDWDAGLKLARSTLMRMGFLREMLQIPPLDACR